MPSFQKPPTVSDDYRAVDIYRKAAKVIFGKGFTATSMGDIADAVDLTKGGLYYYIKGKEALLFAIMSFALDLLEKEVLAPSRRLLDPRIRLQSMLAGHLRVVLQDPSAMTILIEEEEHLGADHLKKIRNRKNAYTDTLRSTIEELLELTPGPGRVEPEVAAQSFIGMIHWAVRWYDGPDTDEGYAAAATQITALALGGLMGDAGRMSGS